MEVAADAHTRRRRRMRRVHKVMMPIPGRGTERTNKLQGVSLEVVIEFEPGGSKSALLVRKGESDTGVPTLPRF